MRDGRPGFAGSILALAALLYMTVPIWNREPEAAFGSPWVLALLAVGASVVFAVVAGLAPRTVWLASAGWIAGAVVAAVSAAITAQWVWLLPLILHAALSRYVLLAAYRRKREREAAAWFEAVQRHQAQRGRPHLPSTRPSGGNPDG